MAWRECDDKEALASLKAGCCVEAWCFAHEGVAGFTPCIDVGNGIWWNPHSPIGLEIGRKFRVEVPEPEPEQLPVPEGCERWGGRADGFFAIQRDSVYGIEHGPTDTSRLPVRTLYFEFHCPDGEWRHAATPTVWWTPPSCSLHLMPGSASGEWLTAASAIVRKA